MDKTRKATKDTNGETAENAKDAEGKYRQDERDGRDLRDGSCTPTDESGPAARGTAVQRGAKGKPAIFDWGGAHLGLPILDCGSGEGKPQMHADERGGGSGGVEKSTKDTEGGTAENAEDAERKCRQDEQDLKDGSCAPMDESGSMATAVQRGAKGRLTGRTGFEGT